MLKNLLFLILTIIISVLLFSCNSTKRVQRQNDELYQKAVTNKVVFNGIGQIWASLNPCPPNSVEYIPGKTITIIDTIQRSNDYLNGNIIEMDSLLNKNCPTANLDSLKKAIQKNYKPIIITVTHNKTDTLSIPDPRQVKFANDSLNFLRGQISILKKSSTDDKATITKIRRTNIFLWIGGIIFFLISMFLTVKTILKF